MTSYPEEIVIYIHITSVRLFQTDTVYACISFKETLRRRWPDIFEVQWADFLSCKAVACDKIKKEIRSDVIYVRLCFPSTKIFLLKSGSDDVAIW